MSKILTTQSGEGLEIAQYLIKKLGIPSNVESFTVRFEAKSPIIVENCKFFAEEQDKTK